MTFREREKRRLDPLKQQLFSPSASRDGLYRGARRSFCLHEDCRDENLHTAIRERALSYFKCRRIKWHDGKKDLPSNHLCCSQTCCVNFWFPFIQAPGRLARVLRGLGYDVDRMLPIDSDLPNAPTPAPFVAFEWIGERNYLCELSRGEVADDSKRTRGSNFTSLDFCLRFLRTDGRIQIVAGEWKYTEYYPKHKDLRRSPSGTDRLERIYGPHLKRSDSQILGRGVERDVKRKVKFEDLFFDPFDQLMRQQLLCSAMERRREMNADIVSLLHVAPCANRELMHRVTSSSLEACGSDVHKIWGSLVQPGRFRGVAVEALLNLVLANAPTAQTRHYLELRYGGMV